MILGFGIGNDLNDLNDLNEISMQGKANCISRVIITFFGNLNAVNIT